MSFVSPLTQRQKSVWSLLNKGLSVSKVAEILKTSRQYVNQTKLSLEAQLSKTLLEVAQVNNIQVRRLYSDKAILLGYHPGLDQETIITYTNNQGIKVWYWHENPEAVTDEVFLRETRQYLLDLAQERGIELTAKEKETHPARLAQAIFSRLVPELRQ